MPRPLTTSKDDWIRAGFLALTQAGPGAVRAEALARALKVSKGGFYGQFAGSDAFRDAMMETWRQYAVDDIITALDQINGARARLERLIQIASEPAPDSWGGARVEPAIRAWALSDKAVSTALHDADTARQNWLADQFTALGGGDQQARLFYATYIGYVLQGAEGRAEMAPDLQALLARLLP